MDKMARSNVSRFPDMQLHANQIFIDSNSSAMTTESETRASAEQRENELEVNVEGAASTKITTLDTSKVYLHYTFLRCWSSCAIKNILYIWYISLHRYVRCRQSSHHQCVKYKKRECNSLPWPQQGSKKVIKNLPRFSRRWRKTSAFYGEC